MSFLQLPKNNWRYYLPQYVKREDMIKLDHKIEHLYETEKVLPSQNAIFKALELTDFDNVRCVILGQDPYPHGAVGLSFSKSRQSAIPASLENIFIERYHDLGLPASKTPDLTYWAKQGVLLLNTVLTVQAGNSNSHRGIGWEELTDAVIKALNDSPHPIVYILWGAQAQEKENLIDRNNRHLIIKSSHPSPRSASISFFGSYPFSKTNHFLVNHGAKPIDWRN